MRWRGEGPAYPQLGDVRRVRRFAWFPVQLEPSFEWVWLEHFTAVESYRVCVTYSGLMKDWRLERAEEDARPPKIDWEAARNTRG